MRSIPKIEATRILAPVLKKVRATAVFEGFSQFIVHDQNGVAAVTFHGGVEGKINLGQASAPFVQEGERIGQLSVSADEFFRAVNAVTPFRGTKRNYGDIDSILLMHRAKSSFVERKGTALYTTDGSFLASHRIAGKWAKKSAKNERRFLRRSLVSILPVLQRVEGDELQIRIFSAVIGQRSASEDFIAIRRGNVSIVGQCTASYPDLTNVKKGEKRILSFNLAKIPVSAMNTLAKTMKEQDEKALNTGAPLITLFLRNGKMTYRNSKLTIVDSKLPSPKVEEAKAKVLVLRLAIPYLKQITKTGATWWQVFAREKWDGISCAAKEYRTSYASIRIDDEGGDRRVHLMPVGR